HGLLGGRFRLELRRGLRRRGLLRRRALLRGRRLHGRRRGFFPRRCQSVVPSAAAARLGALVKRFARRIGALAFARRGRRKASLARESSALASARRTEAGCATEAAATARLVVARPVTTAEASTRSVVAIACSAAEAAARRTRKSRLLKARLLKTRAIAFVAIVAARTAESRFRKSRLLKARAIAFVARTAAEARRETVARLVEARFLKARAIVVVAGAPRRRKAAVVATRPILAILARLLAVKTPRRLLAVGEVAALCGLSLVAVAACGLRRALDSAAANARKLVDRKIVVFVAHERIGDAPAAHRIIRNHAADEVFVVVGSLGNAVAGGREDLRAAPERYAVFDADAVAVGDPDAERTCHDLQVGFPRTRIAVGFAFAGNAPRRARRWNDQKRRAVARGNRRRARMQHVFADQHRDAAVLRVERRDAAPAREVALLVEHAVGRQVRLAMHRERAAALEAC